MFEKMKSLLQGDNTVAALEAALAEIDVQALREAQSRIAAERQGLLLSGTNAQLLDAEHRLDAARIDVERAQAAREVLEPKLAEARAREAETTYMAAHERALAARKAWAEKAVREITKIDKAMASIIAEAEQVAAQIRELHNMRRPHQFTGDAIDQMPTVPMPGEAFAAEGSRPDWLAKRLRELPVA